MSGHTRVYGPQRMSAPARAALIDTLYATHCRVFDGVDRATFGRYVVDSPADETRILVLRDDAGQARGYCAFHAFVQRHLGRRMVIVRIEIGAERAWRRRGFAGPFIVREMLRVALRYPGLPRYFFACFVHPSAYVSLVRHVGQRVWPNPHAPTPARVEALMHSLARAFGVPHREGIAEVGWVAKGDRPPGRLSPEAAFYLARNPGYGQGQGLMTVLPISTPDVLRGSAHFVGRQLAAALGAGPVPIDQPARSPVR